MPLRRLGAALLTLLCALAALTGTSSATAAARLVTGGAPVAFSPNGDGVQDVARVHFTLARPARVVVRVLDEEGTTVHGPQRLGRLDAGARVWRWNGAGPARRIVDDGDYTVRVTAVRGTRSVRASVGVRLDTVLERGHVVTTRRTVHPRATAVRDSVQLSYVQPDFNEGAEYVLPGIHRAVLRIRDARGRQVHERTVRGAVAPRFTWTGRRDGGAVRPGTYAARLEVRDAAGNRQRYRIGLHVSDDQLTQQTWSRSFDAADAMQVPAIGSGCNGCATCPPGASARFEGGLSFPPCSEEFGTTTGHFAEDLPFDVGPSDEYRISATGGPTEPGGDDRGNLFGTPTVPGDGTTTTPWLPVRIAWWPYLPAGELPVSWAFSTYEQSYDVASFTVEVRRWVPVT